MRELIVTTFLTLDGVMQAPGGPEEDSENGFKFGGWSVPFWDESLGEEMTTFLSKPFDLVLGRKTYDIFAGYWPTASDDAVGKPFNAATKYVASRGTPNLTWENSVHLEGDVAEAIANLKQTDGPELQVHGSGNLIQTLLRNNLVDHFHLIIYPVLLGAGKRLFADGTIAAALKVMDSKVSPKGIVVANYVPAGDVEIGSFD